jgi:non-ribosomal peptide synthetase component F
MERQPLTNLISWQGKDPVSSQEIFSTWCTGGTLILIPEELRREVGGLLHLVEEEGIERLFLPFVVLEHLVEMAAHEQVFPSRLRQIITAGEQLHITPRVRSFFEKVQNCVLENQYGPTEAHVVTAFTLTGPPAQWPKLPPIGRPISNTQIFVLDPTNRPVPIGVPGELCIGGACLARGYLNRPELTDQKFVSVSIGSEKPVRLYRTGDLARILPDGNI